jgi:hypothetical protein
MKKKVKDDKSSLAMVIRPIEDEFFQDYSDDEANEETNRLFDNFSRAATSIFYNNTSNNSETIKNNLLNNNNNNKLVDNENKNDLFLNNEDALSTRQPNQNPQFSVNLKLMNAIA